MGVIWSKLGYIEKAVEAYKTSIGMKQDNPYPYLNLSIIYKDRNDYMRAVDVISDGIRNNISCSFLYYNRALFLMHSGSLEDSMKDLETAITLSPELLDYLDKDEEFIPLHKLNGYRRLFTDKTL
jgi:tetratricopeptide (TPR) repeat protein